MSKARRLIESLSKRSLRINRAVWICDRDEDDGGFISWRLWLLPDSQLSRDDLRLTIAKAKVDSGLVGEVSVGLMEADESAGIALLEQPLPASGQQFRRISYTELGDTFVREGLILQTETAMVD